MKIAALYDIHGNLPALEAFLKEIEREDVDMIVIGGDIVPGPMSLDVLAVLQHKGDRVKWIRGNSEREVVEAFDGGPVSHITLKEIVAVCNKVRERHQMVARGILFSSLDTGEKLFYYRHGLQLLVHCKRKYPWFVRTRSD